MTFLDGVLLFLIAAGGVQGYFTGLIRQVAAIVGAVAGLGLGLALMSEAGLALARSLGVSPRIAPVLGFILVFVVVQVMVFALSKLAESILGLFKLTFVNRVSGAVAGGIKVAVLISILLVPLATIDVPDAASRASSRLYDPVARAMPIVWDLAARQMPRVDGLREQFDHAAQTLRRRLSSDPPDPS